MSYRTYATNKSCQKSQIMPTITPELPTRFDPALNAARRALYRFTALVFGDPLTGTWLQLADSRSQACVCAACELLRGELAAVTPLGLGELPPGRLDPAVAFARLPASSEELNAEYEQTFGLLVTAGCPPYETEYIDGKLNFQRSAELADIAGYYRAFGLDAAADHTERPDHIALELEFMAVLIDLECRATTDDQFQVSRNAQANFVRDHLSWWVPSFARLLAKENPDRFLAALGQFLCAFLPAERALLGVAPQLMPAQPSRLEHPEECAGCLLQPL